MNKKQVIEKARDIIEDSNKYKHKYRDPLTGAECRYETKDGILFVYIWHSNEKRDWLTNFFATSKEVLDGRVHSGYYYAALNMLLANIMSDEFMECKKIFIAGYSMGGGIAEVMGYLYSGDMRQVCVVNLDGAKVVNKRLARHISKMDNLHIYKIENGNSPVHKVPFNFVTSGEVIHIGEREKWWKISVMDHHWDYFYEHINRYLGEKQC